MMPPKKSLAARTSHESAGTNGDHVNGKDDKATPPEEKSEGEVKSSPKKNIFTETVILEGKRKRCLPPSQEMLNMWLTTNFEKSTDAEVTTNVNITYDHYVTACIAANNTVPVKVEELRKTIFEMFGSSFVVKDDSAYKGVIRTQKKKKRSSAKKVQADTVKMKDVLRTTFTTLGNPKKGLRFRALQQSIAANFPALKIELHPAVLKRALERGSYSGDLECLRGIGACGYYRLHVDDDEEEEEDDKPKKEKKEKHDGSGDGTEKDKESNSDDNKDVESKKEGQTEGSGDSGDSGKQGEGKKGKDKKKAKLNSKSKSKSRRGRPVTRKLVHSDPQKVEDCFPMAFTYMSEPKATSIGKIKKYLVYHYNVQREDKIKDAVKYGIESGYWEQVSGSGFSGKLELTVEAFNPSDDRDMCGKIMNAIVACSDPKICSAKLLRGYIVAYHTKFNVLEKPFLFKHALERGIHRGTIRQLSGIGASGSYQLTIPFTPSPIVLAGKDTEDDYVSDEEEITGGTVDQLELYRDAYVPRPTKRRGHGRQSGGATTTPKPAVHVRQPPTVRRAPPKDRQLQKPLAPKKKGKSAKSENGLPKKKTPKRAGRQQRARSPSSDDDVPEVKGKSSKRSASQKRARSPSSSDDDVPEVKGKSSKRGASQKRARSPSSSEDDVPEVKGKSSKRGSSQKRARSPSSSDDDVPEVKGKSSKRGASQKRARSPSSSDDDVPEVKGKSSKRASPQKRARSPSSSDDDVPEVKGKSSKRGAPQKRARSPSSSDDDVPEVKGKSSKSASPQKRARSPSSSGDDVPEVKGKSSKRGAPQKRARSPSSSDDDVPEVKGKSSKSASPQKRARSPSSSGDDVPEVKGKSSKRGAPQKRARSRSTSVESGPTANRKSGRQSRRVNAEYVSDSMSDDGDEAYTPLPSKSRSPRKSHSAQPASRKKTPKKPATSRSSSGTKSTKVSADRLSSESDNDVSDASGGEPYSPRPSKSRGTPQSAAHKKISLSKRSSSRPAAAGDLTDDMSDASGDGKVVAPKKKSAARKGSKRRR